MRTLFKYAHGDFQVKVIKMHYRDKPYRVTIRSGSDSLKHRCQTEAECVEFANTAVALEALKRAAPQDGE